MTQLDETEIASPVETTTRVEARRNIPVLILIGVMCVLFAIAAFIGIDGRNHTSSVVEHTTAPAAQPARPTSTSGEHT